MMLTTSWKKVLSVPRDPGSEHCSVLSSSHSEEIKIHKVNKIIRAFITC